MNSRTLNFGLIGLLIFLGLIFFVFLFKADKMLEHKYVQLASVSSKYQTLTAEEAQLTQDKTDITKYSSLNQVAESVVPQDKDQAETVREIVNLASQSGIPQLSSITFPPSALGGGSVKTKSGLTQVTPVKGIPGVYDLEITISQDNSAEVPYSNFLNFLTKLEQNRRTALVNSVTVEPDQTNPSVVAFTIVLDEYIKP